MQNTSATASRPPQKKISFINTFYLLVSPIALAILLPYDLMTNGWNTDIMVFTLVYWFLTGFGITGGYHRFFSHRAYEAPGWYRAMLLVFGAGALQNSALKWCTDHRVHHRQVDSDFDPYNIKRGFFWAHMGWVFYGDPPMKEADMPLDLKRDKWVMLQHKYYLPLALITCFGLPTLVGWMFGSALTGFVMGGLLRVVVTTHSTFLVNSAAHYFGNQPYTDTNSARDSWLVAILSNGEGYHNFHHHFQHDYRNGIQWFHWDPSKWVLGFSARMGWITNLRAVSEEEILLSKMRMEEKRLQNSGYNVERLKEFTRAVQNAQARWRELKKDYQAMKKSSRDRTNQKIAEMKQSIAEMKLKMAESKREFKTAYRAWKSQCRALAQSI